MLLLNFLERFVRTVLKDFTLSNGTRIPKGSTIEASHATMMKDPNLYPEPEVLFQPFSPCMLDAKLRILFVRSTSILIGS